MSIPTFAVGDTVVLHDLTSRQDLNGKAAIVTAIDTARDRLAVKVSDSLESVRVRAKNAKKEDSQVPSKAASAKRSIDATLYVDEKGHFVQPGASSAPTLPGCASGLERIQLPVGHWEVVMVEQEMGSRQVNVTMVAGAGSNEDDDWGAVNGLRCMRKLLLPDHAASLDQMEATVQGSELLVAFVSLGDEEDSAMRKAIAPAEDPSSVMEMECDSPHQ